MPPTDLNRVILVLTALVATVGAIPVLHAAALDRPGNVKGGPYSKGAFPGAGQFGVLRIDDDGTHVTVELEGRDWTGAVLVRHTFTAG